MLKQQPQFIQLQFAPRPPLLWQATTTAVHAWNWLTGQLHYVCDGRFLGHDEAGDVFLTQIEAEQFAAWAVADGRSVPLETLNPDHFPSHVRFVVYIEPKVSPNTLLVGDVFGRLPTQKIRLGIGGSDEIENWAIVPNQQTIAYTVYGGDFSYETAFGRLTNFGDHASYRSTGFPATRHLSIPPLYFAPNHHLLLSCDQNNFTRYDLQANQVRDTIYVGNGGGTVVAVHPRWSWLIAANQMPIAEPLLHGWRLIDVRAASPTNSEGRVWQVFPTAAPVTYLAFDPQGYVLASLLGDGTIHFWEVATGRPLGRGSVGEMPTAEPHFPPTTTPTKRLFHLMVGRIDFCLTCAEAGQWETVVNALKGVKWISAYPSFLSGWLAEGQGAADLAERMVQTIFPQFVPHPAWPLLGRTQLLIALAQPDVAEKIAADFPLGAGFPPTAVPCHNVSGAPLLCLSLDPLSGLLGVQEQFLEEQAAVLAYGVIRL